MLEAAEYIPLDQLGTTDDCGFSPFCDDTSTSRDTAFAKIRARVLGTALASDVLGAGLMEPDDDEEERLRSVALQNAQSILLARQRAEEELVRAKEALQQQTEWLRVTLASIGDAVITTDTNGRVTSLNPVAELLTGWTREDARGEPLERVFRIVNEESRQPVENPALRALRDGRVVGLANHTLLIARDGSERAIDDSAAPIRDEQGEVLGVVLIFRDVTARRQDDERLRQSEQTSRFLADASTTLAELTDYQSTLQRLASLAVPAFADWCIVDMREADGRVRRLAVTHADPAKAPLAHELTRRPPPRPSGKHGVMKVLRTGEPLWLAAVPDSLLQEAAEDEAHLRVLRQLGLRSSICVPIRSRATMHGALTFATAESGRIYDRTHLATAEDLAQRAAVAIDNTHLVAALKDSDRRKDEFLAMLAHELRNPLAPIRTSVQIVRAKSPAVPELQWATEVIERQVHQMARLVDDLLDVSRITRGKIELRKERVELAAIVRSAVEASRPLIENRGHELTVTVPSQPIHLEADPTRLAQVLLNLLNNAAKYMDRAGRIWLTAERAGDEVVIRVRDTGIGIPAEMLPRIFDLFTQVDRSLERAEGGLGIGLTLVRRLVEMHGGTVEAHSEGPGRGSEFVVRLPIAGPAEDREPQGAAGGGDEAAAPAARRILVVDDNQDAAESLGMLLRALGHEVRTAHDGLEAVRAVPDFRPDVVLLDIGMPKLNGYEAARQIREQPGGAALVLVALTGWGQEEDRRLSHEAGFDHHMTKPVELADLQKLLAEVVPGHPRRRPRG